MVECFIATKIHQYPSWGSFLPWLKLTLYLKFPDSIGHLSSENDSQCISFSHLHSKGINLKSTPPVITSVPFCSSRIWRHWVAVEIHCPRQTFPQSLSTPCSFQSLYISVCQTEQGGFLSSLFIKSQLLSRVQVLPLSFFPKHRHWMFSSLLLRSSCSTHH